MLVLASASPRRQELLRAAGISFVVQPAHVAEDALAGESAQDCAERLAREKALAVSRLRPRDAVLGADTVVAVDDQILGKPVGGRDAARMLRMLSGRTHRVITGVCLVVPNSQLPDDGARLPEASGSGTVSSKLESESETTRVTMAELTDEEIAAYVASGEPMDKAGAYAIQGMASRWIPQIEGDYSNVVGLPVARVYGMLRRWMVL